MADSLTGTPALEGRRVPEMTFRYLDGKNESVDVSAASLFEGKRVVVFTVPGAFTPTCSNSHVPSYVTNDLKGDPSVKVDDVICLSWNDRWVMKGWQKDLNVPDEKIRFLADHKGEFTQKLELAVEKSDLGGLRTMRCSMYVEDGTITKFFPAPTAWEHSGAEHMKTYLMGKQ